MWFGRGLGGEINGSVLSAVLGETLVTMHQSSIMDANSTEQGHHKSRVDDGGVME